MVFTKFLTKNKNKDYNFISLVNYELNKIIMIEDITISRIEFVKFANNLFYSLSEKSPETIKIVLSLIGEYFLIMIKKPNMLVKALLYMLNPCYFKSIMQALEESLNNVVDDVDTIVDFFKLSEEKEKYTAYAYLNRLLDLYVSYNKPREQTLVRK